MRSFHPSNSGQKWVCCSIVWFWNMVVIDIE